MATYPIQLLTTTKVPAAPTGMRSVKLQWKTKRDGTKPLSPNKYIHIPVVTPQQLGIDVSQGEDKKLSSFLTGMVHDYQDTYLHTMVTLSIEDGKTITSVDDTTLDISHLISDYLAVSTRGGAKLSKDMVTEWFNSDLRDALVQFLRDNGKGPTEADTITNNYLEYYRKLSGPSTQYQPVLATKLLDMLALATDIDNKVWEKLAGRLNDMTVEKTLEDLGI